VQRELAAARQREVQFTGALESLFEELSATRAEITAMEAGTGQAAPDVPATQPTTRPADDPG
jgi:hypothetical protein